IEYYTSLVIISLIFFIIIGFFFYKSYRELQSYALKAATHFQPSIRDLIIHLIQQVYYVVFLGIVLVIPLNSIIRDSLPPWVYLGVALIISLGIQTIFVLFAFQSKRQLLATAQIPVQMEIVEYVRQNHPKGHLINEFRFAEIELASLFLSAGVMTLGWSRNICLISQYFNWKLSEEELIAVLSHEEAHLARHHIAKAYLISGTDAILRALRIFCVLTALTLLLNNEPLFALESLFSWIFLLLILLVFFISACLVFIRHYRVYLQEIRADIYGGTLVGYELLANTLKKLPSVIPAPISGRQLDFLRFRISILREEAKRSN
ncbi:MAG: M48 family metalloprotease, partial [Candidatus Heimdallarchaeota archaeon]